MDKASRRAARPIVMRLFDESAPDLRARLVAIYGVLALLNGGAWVWALAAFHDNPALLVVALVVYGLGLRHAVDADHIAAIDNVTRKLMQENRRPVSVGFFFALGHSAVVILATVAVVGAANMLGELQGFRGLGGAIGTSISTLFLLVIAAMNLVIFFSIHRTYRRIRRGGGYAEAELDALNGRGLLARIMRPLFRLVSRSWHMFPLGFLFGLGFDTATEVAMFSLSATQVANGVPFIATLVFPFLFTAGMSLIDTTDGVVMLAAYEWAFVKPMRKLYYNMTITLVSVVVALLVGGIEALRLVADGFTLSGRFWDAVGVLNENFNNLGLVVIGVFLAAWALSFLIYRASKLDNADQAPVRAVGRGAPTPGAARVARNRS